MWNRGAFAGILVLVVSRQVCGINIELDFTHDTFLSGNPTAKAAVAAAAADISTAITNPFAAVTRDSYTGWNGSTFVTFNWNYTYANPASGDPEEITIATIPADTVRVFIGPRNVLIPGNLGGGVPAQLIDDVTGMGTPGELPGALAAAEDQSEAAYRRGGPGQPVIGNATGSVSIGNVTQNYSVNYAPAYGSVWFDVDQNNDDVQDSAAMLADYWHYDHTTPVASGKNDFYSVALHEIMHTLGIGSSGTWEALRNGTTWNGSEVQAITGTGQDLVTSDGKHLAVNLMSTRITDGAPQEVLMDPTLATGQRKFLTALDLAFLRDIGYDTITPPLAVLPGDYNGDNQVTAADYTSWRDTLGQTGPGLPADGNGNLVIDQGDYGVWRANYGQSAMVASVLTASHPVPEPSSITSLLLAVAASMWIRSRSDADHKISAVSNVG